MTTAREQWQAVRETDVKVTLPLGPNTVDRYLGDPKRISFMLARYAFAAKMLADKKTILEVGCGDGFGTLSLLTNPNAQVLGFDFDPSLINYANQDLLPALRKARPKDADRVSFRCVDFLDETPIGWHGVVTLDCIEHISPINATTVLAKIHSALAMHGVAVIGTPNEYAAHLGSAHSVLGHINNYTPEKLRDDLLIAGFTSIFLFGMNDCTLHVGHPELWHYILALAVKS